MILLGVIILAVIAIQLDPVQNWLVKKVTVRLSKSLNTEVKVERVSFSFFNRMDLEGMLVRDHQSDTLLYAGTMKVRITDWFIFKDKADLKYVGLEDAVIKTNRTDSVWNYQFLVDYFAASESPQPTKAKKNKSIEFDLKKLDFKNVSLIQADRWRGETMTLHFPRLVMDGKKMDFEKGDLDVAELVVDKLYFGIHNYKGNRKIKPPGGAFTLDIGVLLKIDRLELNNATFVNEVDTERAPYKHFDGAHMHISKINGVITQFSFLEDTIRGKVDLSAVERSGFELKKLKADFRFDTEIMEFANLDLQTPRSRLRDYYSMRYSDFNDDMSDFTTNVLIDARLRQSDIHSDDIAFFAPELRDWNREIFATGNFRGKVNSFKGDNIFVRSGNSSITGDIAVTGIESMSTARFTLAGNASTTYNDLVVFVPGVRNVTTPHLPSLGQIRFNGNFNGSLNDFNAKGNVSTDIGDLYADINMNLPSRGQPTYRGLVNTSRFHLGKFLNIAELGNVSLNGRINGTGFNVNTLRTNFDGTIGSLAYGDYTYTNIATNGTFQKGAFAGEVRMNDPNLNFTSNISIDFNGQYPRFLVLGDVANANLQALRLTKDNLQLAGLFDLDFSGTNIDNFLGYAKLINASLLHDSTRLAFDSLSIQTEYIDGEKLLSVRSNELEAYVKGQYNILDLPRSIQTYLHNYYPSIIDEPTRIPRDQRFTVNLLTRNIGEYLHIFEPKLSGFDNAVVSGSINTTWADSGFAVVTEIPFFKYDNVSFSNVEFTGVGNTNTLQLVGSVEMITVGDSTYFPNTTINVVSGNDISRVSIKTKANYTLNEADLNATVHTMEDGVQINFNPSSFVINDEKWILEKEGELVLRKHYVAARDIKFTQGFQELTVTTRTPDGGNVDELVINLKEINLGDFIHFATREPRMEGRISGEVIITDIFDRLVADARLEATDFWLDNDSIGRVTIIADYAKSTGKVNFNLISREDPYNLAIRGYFDTKDTTLKPLSTTLSLNGTRIGFVNRFLSSIFSNIDGYATGNIQLIGDFNQPHILGQVTVRDASMLVNYTKVEYFIDSAVLNFGEDRLDFGQFNLRDKYNNTAVARGAIYQRAFNDMRFDFDLSTNKLLLLDTRASDNERFYGRAMGRAAMTVRGPEDNIQMTITGEVNDTSYISIPTSDSKESSEADFIVFRQYGREEKTIVPSTTNVVVDLDVSATNMAQIDVILDPVEGDVLKARGNGRLRIHAGTNEETTIRGRYNIEEGSYGFNFQSIIKKPFEIDRTANNYIEWNGDPYEAKINVDALYIAEDVSLSSLVGQSLQLGSSVRAYRDKVYIIASLTDKLTSPTVKFRFDFPPGTPFKNDYEFNEFLTRMASDENEMNKQVAYLLIFNTFAPYGEGKNLAQNITSLAYNSISQLANRYFNALLHKYLNIAGFRLDVNASVYSSASLLGTGSTQNALERLDRMGLGVKFWRGFANNKIIVNVGGNIDFSHGLGATTAAFQSGDFQLLPDVSVEFVLDRTGRLRLVLFQRNTLDISTGNTSLGKRNRTGVSLTFTKDADKEF